MLRLKYTLFQIHSYTSGEPTLRCQNHLFLPAAGAKILGWGFFAKIPPPLVNRHLATRGGFLQEFQLIEMTQDTEGLSGMGHTI